MNNIFICGCGHSGTTLLLAMLLNNKHCHGIRYESRIFFNADEHTAVNFINSFIDEKYDYFVEKTPTNVYKLAIIRKHWPESKIIVCVRNPVDTVSSLMRRGFDLDYSINRYINDNLAWINSDHNVIIFKYENLLEQRVKYIQELCDILEIEYDDNMLNFYKNQELFFNVDVCKYQSYVDSVAILDSNEYPCSEGDNHRLYRNTQLKKQLFDDRIFRVNRLSEHEINHIHSRTKEIMTHLKY